MRFWEAMRDLEEGKKVRLKEWAADCYLQLDLDGTIFDESNGSAFCIEEWALMEWELYEESIKLYTFAQVVKGLRYGKRFRRKHSTWPIQMELALNLTHPRMSSEEIFSIVLSEMSIEDFVANDWIEVKE